MKERRVAKFGISLTPKERELLETLADHAGGSGADVLRRLLLEEARRVKLLPATTLAINRLEVSNHAGQ